MKRILSITLILCLTLTGLAAFASPVAEAAPNQSMLRLNHADIEQLVRRNSPVIQNNRITEQGLNDMVGTPAAISSIIGMQNALLAANAATERLIATIEVTDAVSLGVVTALENDIRSNAAQFGQLATQLEQMHSDPVRNTVSRGIQQINAANRQIIWGVESMYLGYHALTRQIEQTRESLETLNRNIEIMERRYAVGHVTARALQNVRSTRTQLEAGIVNMENELGNLTGQINLMLGRPFDAPIQMGRMPTADREFLDSRDPAADLRQARSSNSAINIARIDRDEQASQGGDRARRQEAIADNTLESEERALLQRFESAVNSINDRLTTLELAEEQLEILKETLEETERRFERGMIARVDLEQARSEVAIQEIRVAAADAELFGAIRRYEWLVRGLSI